MSKVLFLFWHGLGDNILATPAIRKYKETTGNFIGWAMLRRFRKTGLFDCNPCIDELHWVSDAWNDFGSYDVGCKRVVEESEAIRRENCYDSLCVVHHRSSSKHKILRTADEMGVRLGGDVHTEVHYCEAQVRQLARSVGLPHEYVFFHGKTGVRNKDLPRRSAERWLAKNGIDLPLVSPDFTWDSGSLPISLAMHVMKRAKGIVVADSVMYHAAHAMDLKVDLAYFGRGKAVWDVVRPLHPGVEKVVFEL